MYAKVLSVSFPPILRADARVLILGSMPGVASLRAKQYYAHPQNAFWPIVAEIGGFDRNVDYDARCAALCEARFALWDVLHACIREGSLDSAIDRASETANDIETMLRDHPNIDRVCFNGGAAESLFKRHFPRTYRNPPVQFIRLPSTSPAHASLRYAQKLTIWRNALSLPRINR
jgi:double-stranded uracil-DNA glycosylase